MDTLIEWMLTNGTVGTWVLVILAVLIVFVFLIYLIGFIQGRALSIGPLKIGEKPKGNRMSDSQISRSPGIHVIEETLQPQEINGETKNRITIAGDFLLWEKCTILIWVWVTPKGVDLRDAPSNRYILAHHTGFANREKETFKNQFCFRYSLRKAWQVTFSNEGGEYPNRPLNIDDALETGWHQFLISWDKTKPSLRLLIDGGKNGSDLITSSLKSWPEKIGDNVIVGAWPSNWDGHYCNTKIYLLQIINDCLLATDKVVIDHYQRKPA